MARRSFDFLSLWVCVLAGACLGGCIESRIGELPAMQQNAELAPPVDDFWMLQAIAESQPSEPPPFRPHSISLGNVGNSPLTGGVMRDTPMPPPPEAPWSSASNDNSQEE